MKTKEAFMNMNEEEESHRQEAFKKPETGLTFNEKSFLTLDKTKIIDMAQATVDKYTDGDHSPYEGLLLAKKLIDLGEAIKDNIADNASNELKLAKSEKRVLLGTTVTEQMVGTRYDFKPCGDKIYDELKAKLTERENFLKTITAPQITGDTDTGETWMVSPPVKSGKLGLVIKY